MSPQNPSKNTRYFLEYLRKKIRDGIAKQVDIATTTQKSTSYINMLYLKDPKNVPVGTQEKVAKYFNISHDELLKEGKTIFNNTSPIVQLGPQNPENDTLNNIQNLDSEDIVSQLNTLITGVLKNNDQRRSAEEKSIKTLQLLDRVDAAICTSDSRMIIDYQNRAHSQIYGYLKGSKYIDLLWKERGKHDVILELSTKGEIHAIQKIDDKYYNIKASGNFREGRLYDIIETVHNITTQQLELLERSQTIAIHKTIFDQLTEGVTLFDEDRNFIFSSNRWGVLDSIDITKKPSIEQILFVLKNKVTNFEDILKTIDKVQKQKKKQAQVVKFKDEETNFLFELVPITLGNGTIGTLIINSPIK